MHKSETHFKNKIYFSTPRYKIYYTSLPDDTAHGGTMILIKETIEHYELWSRILSGYLNKSERICTWDDHHSLPHQHNLRKWNN